MKPYTSLPSNQMKATNSAVLFVMLYKVVLTFESVDEILKCDYSNVLLFFLCCRLLFIFLEVEFWKNCQIRTYIVGAL